jgi:hypothetical protein
MLKYLFTFVLLCTTLLAFSQEEEEEELPSLEEINNQIDNPLSRFWSLIIQENLAFNSGDAVNGTYGSNVLNFQPSLPVPVGKSHMLLVRPVFPFVSSPEFNENGDKIGTDSGFGDIQVFSLYGPDKEDGVVWAVGLTFAFPTASSDNLGSGKYQMGPAAMLLSMGERWVLGTIIQHWNSIGGDSNRGDVTKTEFQYIIRKKIPGKAMSIGMGPSISVNWEAAEGNKVTFPIGLGITKTVKWGNTPWKLRIEPQYSIIKPDDYGTQWNLRIQIAPILKNPFLEKK